jgi:hypothetical protein
MPNGSDGSRDRRSLTSRRISRTPWNWLAAALVLFVVPTVIVLWPPWRPADVIAPRPQQAVKPILPESPYLNTAARVAYVGDASCVRCHAEIANSYRAHPMGRSAVLATDAKPEANGVVFSVADLIYSVLHRDGKLFHREEKRDSSGRVVAANEGDVRYAIGSGRRGISFLVERDGALFQSPISWYAQEQRWDLPPGYDLENMHFSRPIIPACLFCHTNRVEYANGKAPIFHGLSIGCERCHGPGELHERRQQVENGRDLTIVNPARLDPPSLREAVCEQCHLQGTNRGDQPDHSMFDYRPGLQLEKFLYIEYSRADRFSRRAVGQVEQMRDSTCYQASRKQLGCISCHDPHKLPTGAERVAFYRARCLECHADRGCSLPEPNRIAQNADDCTACHMPRAHVTDIAHTAMTDHSIPRRAAPAPLLEERSRAR